MCEPTALAIGAVATKVGGSIAKAGAQNKAAKANKASALEALRLGNRDVNARLREETAAASGIEQDILAAGTTNVSTAAASAAESGVVGGSVDAMIADILRQQGVATDRVAQNLDMVRAQGERQKEGLLADAQSRINGVPKANGLATGLEIAGAGLSFLTDLKRYSLRGN